MMTPVLLFQSTWLVDQQEQRNRQLVIEVAQEAAGADRRAEEPAVLLEAKSKASQLENWGEVPVRVTRRKDGRQNRRKLMKFCRPLPRPLKSRSRTAVRISRLSRTRSPATLFISPTRSVGQSAGWLGWTEFLRGAFLTGFLLQNFGSPQVSG